MEVFAGFGVSDEMGCATTLRGLFTGIIGPVQEGEAAGRLRYNPSNAGGCLDAVVAAPCTALRPGLDPEAIAPSTCEYVITPLVDAGEACASDIECKSGSCEGASNNMPNGTCEAVPGLDEPCEFLCADGLYCDVAGGSTCAAQKAATAACNDGDECLSGHCSDSNVCVDPAPICG
jgi:hypothetical protein